MARKFRFEQGPVGGEMTEYETTLAPQCASKHWCGKQRCQGLRGHEGPHWHYCPDGWLEQWQRREDIKGPTDWASSRTPPDHKDYIHPKDMLVKLYTSHNRTEKVQRKKKRPGKRRD
jgi:hypothetical protein